MFDEQKLEAIREYLRQEFNTTDISDEYISTRQAQIFRIDDSGRICQVTVAEEFVEDNDTSEVSGILRRYSFKRYFNNAGVKELVFKGLPDGVALKYE